MSIHRQFSVNKELSENGIRVPFDPNSDGTVPTFILKRQASSNSEYSKMLERRMQPHRISLRNGTANKDIIAGIYREVFVKTVLIGWENLQTESGEPIKYSHAEALKLMTELPDLYEALDQHSQSLAAFQAEQREEDSKNS